MDKMPLSQEDSPNEKKELFDLMFRKHDAIMLLIEAGSGRILDANLAAEAFYGYSLEQLTRMTISDINMLPASQVEQERLRAMREERNYFIFPHKLANGQIRTVEVHSSPVSNRDGKLVLFSIIHDITERKHVEDALLESEEKYRMLIEAAEDAIILTDLEGKRIFANTAYYSNLGYRAGDDISLNGFENVHPDDVEQIKKNIHTLMENGSGVGEYRVRHRDGHWLFRSSKSRLIRDRNDQPVSILTISRDITEKKYVENTLRIKTRELEILFEISTHLSFVQNEAEILPHILDDAQSVLGADSMALILVEQDGKLLRIALASGELKSHIGFVFQSTQGISGQVLKSRKVYITKDLIQDSDLIPPEMSAQVNFGPAIFTPLLSGENITGILLSARKQERAPFPPEAIRLLITISEMFGNAINRIHLHDETIRRLDHLETLRSVEHVIASSIDLRITLKILLNHTLAQFGVDAASVLLLHPQRKTLQFGAAQGFRTRLIEDANVQLNDDYAGRAVMERRVVQIFDRNEIIHNSPFLQLWDKEDFVGYICMPLIAKGEVKGVLEVYQRTPFHPDDEWIGFLETLAGQAAISIDNTQLFDDLQNANMELAIAYDATIEGWSRAMDLRDKESEGHTKRVTQLTLSLAKAMNVPDRDLLHIRRGALLHDIGKMGIPDNILFKQGKLTKKESKIMEQHTVFACDMLEPIHYLRYSLDIPYCHHEKWDGTGYPRGLKGEEIPLAARIFAVADAWDMLTASRLHHKPMSKKEALIFIKEQSGLHFDPQVVQIFLKEIKKF